MTVRNVAWAASVLGLACSVLVPVLGAQSWGGKNCPGVRWSTPTEWRSPEGAAMYLSKPAILPMRDGTLWLGPLLTIRRGPKDFIWPLLPPGDTRITKLTEITIGVFIKRDGTFRYLGTPAEGSPWIETSRAVVDDRGVVHVMWVPSDSDRSRRLFYAQFDGEQWTVPQVAAEKKQFIWHPASVSSLIARGDTLYLVATAADGLVYIRGVHARWTTRLIDLWHGAVPGGYPSLTVLRTGRLVLLTQGAALDTPNTRQSSLQLTSRMFATWSDDDGVTWAPVRPVSDLQSEPALDFHLVQTHDGVLRAIWYQRTDSLGRPADDVTLGGTPGRVQIAESRDRGESWRRLAPSELLRFADDLDTQAMDDSTLAIVLVDRAAEQILLTTWSGVWRPFAHIDASPNPLQTLFGRDDAQRLVLTWGSERGSPRWFVSMVTTLTPCR